MPTPCVINSAIFPVTIKKNGKNDVFVIINYFNVFLISSTSEVSKLNHSPLIRLFP